jgi:uncharacterized protein (TIGR00251 family)
VIDLQDHPDGVLLPVRAQPGAGRAGIRGLHQGLLKVGVTQIAEKGKANKALIEALAKGLHLRRSQIELIAGPTAADKKFLIRGIARDELREKIEKALAAAG